MLHLVLVNCVQKESESRERHLSEPTFLSLEYSDIVLRNYPALKNAASALPQTCARGEQAGHGCPAVALEGKERKSGLAIFLNLTFPS